jgi:hypothetical protein
MLDIVGDLTCSSAGSSCLRSLSSMRERSKHIDELRRCVTGKGLGGGVREREREESERGRERVRGEGG